MSEYDWSGTELSVLYDVFYEQGTALAAQYVSLGYEAEACGDSVALAFWDSKAIDLATMQTWHDTLDLVRRLRIQQPAAA